MKFLSGKKIGLLLMLACSCFMLNSLSAGLSQGAKNGLNKYFEKMPWIGLIANEVSYGPITISQVHIDHGDKLAVAAPGETLSGSLRYKIKTDNLDAMQRYHLIIGIKGNDAQECLAHSMGIWDSKGKTRFKLTAPEKPGVYEVRFLFVEDLKCSTAKNEWNTGKLTPDGHATIGIIIVE